MTPETGNVVYRANPTRYVPVFVVAPLLVIGVATHGSRLSDFASPVGLFLLMPLVLLVIVAAGMIALYGSFRYEIAGYAPGPITISATTKISRVVWTVNPANVIAVTGKKAEVTIEQTDSEPITLAGTAFMPLTGLREELQRRLDAAQHTPLAANVGQQTHR